MSHRRQQIISCFLLSLITPLCAGDAKSKPRIRYQFQIFRIAGHFNSDTSLEKEIWAGKKEEWEKIKKSITLFDKGTFRLGSSKLEINKNGCQWNGQQMSFEKGDQVELPEYRIKMIHSPIIRKESGQLIKMDIQSRQPFQYFEKKEDGLFELKEKHLPVGLVVSLRGENKDKNELLISDLKLLLRWVSKRERIEGVNLRVGCPILEEKDTQLRLRITKGTNYGILLRPEDSRGAIIIRMVIDDH